MFLGFPAFALVIEEPHANHLIKSSGVPCAQEKWCQCSDDLARGIQGTIPPSTLIIAKQTGEFSPVVFMSCLQHVTCLHLAQVNMSLIVHDSEAKACVKALHQAFFEDDDVLTQVEVENLLVS